MCESSPSLSFADVKNALARISFLSRLGGSGGKLSADVSGTTLFQNVTIPAAPILALGFTAATGGADSLGFLVDTVNIQLTDAVCPTTL